MCLPPNCVSLSPILRSHDHTWGKPRYPCQFEPEKSIFRVLLNVAKSKNKFQFNDIVISHTIRTNLSTGDHYSHCHKKFKE